MALILASASAIRRSMLEQAGVDFAIVPPGIDEDEEKASDRGPAELAEALAIRKALAVSAGAGGNWVIGSDSVASVDGRRFGKPAGRAEAAAHLRAFSGKTLELTSAVALACRGKLDWSLADTARLAVRPLSDSFIDSYLDCEWPAIGQCAGAFRLEARGVQLFDRIEGSCFTILGLPLVQLLAALRQRRLIAA